MAGATRDTVGKAELGLGKATGSEKLKSDGIIDQAAGSIQHGYGMVKDAVADVVVDAPGAIADVVNRGRRLGREGNDAVRDRLGDNGPLYLLFGVVGLFAIGAFALARSAPATAPKPSAKRRNRSAKTSN